MGVTGKAEATSDPAAGKGPARPKTIVLLSDGTGNSSAKLFRTNVWRLYDALDLSEPRPAADGTVSPRQIAYYDDGVGTSAFRPLALLGGVFGVGLKRNVLDLYAFLCRNYVEGDQIHVFGFSRGAFTARILVGLIDRQGLVPYETEEALERQVREAYRRYRRERFPGKRPLLEKLLAPCRDLRDRALATGGRGDAVPPAPHRPSAPGSPSGGIAFLGVWDTVGAYGTPVAELTRGIDRWVWPMSMFHLDLSPLVRRACHALALDDERDTFHPLVWDETGEAELVAEGRVAADRISQVWFAGAHSDVGGGYPDGALAGVSLLWMMREAEEAGLRFRAAVPGTGQPTAVEEVARNANPLAPIHDSRQGLAGYYRYQPRRLAAFVAPGRDPDPDKLIMRDPELKGGLLSVKVHASVLDRIRSGPDQYAPIVLPARYEVVPTGDDPVPLDEVNPKRRQNLQEEVWNQVWRRRIVYFATALASLLLLLVLPLVHLTAGGEQPPACRGPQCLLLPVIGALETVLPGFARFWTAAFAARPGTALLGLGAIALLVRSGAILRRRIHDSMRPIWRAVVPPDGVPGIQATHRSRVGTDSRIYRLRTSGAYRNALSDLKWQHVPNGFGAVVLLLLAMLLLAVLSLPLYRGGVVLAEHAGGSCVGSGVTRPVDGATSAREDFPTDLPCWASGLTLEEGKRYLLRLRVAPGGEWRDAGIRATPEGFASARMGWGLGYLALPLRRSISGAWFQPMARIVGPTGAGRTRLLRFERSDQGDGRYVAELVADRTGELFLFVNDVLLPWRPAALYGNNGGAATVTAEPSRPPTAAGR